MVNNRLYGPLPATMFNISTLTIIDLGGNLLSHSLPEAIENGKSIATFNIYGNSITGSLPTGIGGMSSLQSLNVYNNAITGAIPQTLGNLQKLQTVGMMSMQLNQPLPTSLGNCYSILKLNLRVNFLTGTVPSSLGNLSKANLLELQANYLSGTLPAELRYLKSMSQLYLFRNLFTGPVVQIFDPIQQPNLTQVQLNDNAFTGQLPNELFGTRQLTVFVGSLNCFEGSISPSICASQYLSQLALDGASFAPICRSRLFPQYLPFNTYSPGGVANHLTGSIPECLFGMSNLEVLALSGNLLMGTLNDDVALGPSLTNLLLPHNLIEGSIPIAFKERRWQQLDLSYNRLAGNLNGFYPQDNNASSSLTLVVNRLSGSVPSSLLGMTNISILDGNIFACQESGSGLPTKDSESDRYSCGSNAFDTVVFACLALLFLFGLWVIVHRYISYGTLLPQRSIQQHNPFLEHCCDLIGIGLTLGSVDTTVADMLTPSGLAIVQVVVWSFARMRSQFVLFILLYVVLFLPIYAGLHVSFSSYQSLYAWTISAAYLTGQVPVYVLLAAWSALSLMLLSLYDHQSAASTKVSLDLSIAMRDESHKRTMLSEEPSPTSSPVEVHQSDNSPISPPLLSTVRYSVYALCLHLINFVIVGCVNAVFVYISITYGSSVVGVAQLGMALFKLVWTRVVFFGLKQTRLIFPRALFLGCIWWLPPSTTVVEVLLKAPPMTDNTHSKSATRYWTQALLLVCNNILLPLLAASLVNSDCFSNAFVPAPNIVVSTDVDNCIRYACSETACSCTASQPNTLETVFPPPFSYSFQCISSILVAYAPVFAILAAFDTFIVPMKCLLGVYIVYRDEYARKERMDSTTSDQNVARMNSLRSASSLRNIEDGDRTSHISTYGGAAVPVVRQRRSCYGIMVSARKKLWRWTIRHIIWDDISRPASIWTHDELYAALNRAVSNALVVLLNLFGILVTWGLFVPALAPLLCLAVLVRSVHLQIAVGRLLHLLLQRAKKESLQSELSHSPATDASVLETNAVNGKGENHGHYPRKEQVDIRRACRLLLPLVVAFAGAVTPACLCSVAMSIWLLIDTAGATTDSSQQPSAGIVALIAILLLLPFAVIVVRQYFPYCKRYSVAGDSRGDSRPKEGHPSHSRDGVELPTSFLSFVVAAPLATSPISSARTDSTGGPQSPSRSVSAGGTGVISTEHIRNPLFLADLREAAGLGAVARDVESAFSDVPVEAIVGEERVENGEGITKATVRNRNQQMSRLPASTIPVVEL